MMFRTLPLAVLAACLVLPSPAAAQLTDKEVEQAISGAGKLKLRSVCVGATTPGQFDICIQGPVQRIATAVTAAKLAHRSLRADAVTDDMKAPTWMIFAIPTTPTLVAGHFVRLSADKVQLRQVGAIEFINPLASTKTKYAWDNPVGTKLTAQGVTATFDARNLPPGDLDVVVTGEDGSEHAYTLVAPAREQIH